MSPVSYDPKSGVQGPAATLTVLGLAVALSVTMYRPGWGLAAGGIGAAVAAVIWLSALKARLGLVARLGLGLAVGAAIGYGLNALNILPALGH
ncbi:MAG TPA: hypothetical protein VFW55_10215 [Propionicimonas sp.]|nr:hypothetical protein [Propionicimonas sp.]